MINSGIKENVVPLSAEAMLNCRIMPGETIEDVISHLTKVISDDRVRISTVGKQIMASPVSQVDSHGFRAIGTTIGQVYPGAVVTPMIMLGSSDAKHYKGVSNCIYRFLPVNITHEDIERTHGLNERIAVSDFRKSIGFYYWLIRNASL